MAWLEVEITPRSSFVTPLNGGTLFGQWCAMLGGRNQRHLTDLLQGYTAHRPFAVVGDPRPHGHLPRPTLPMYRFGTVPGLGSKEAKARQWMPDGRAQELPLEAWLRECRSERDLLEDEAAGGVWRQESFHPLRDCRHGSLDRAAEHGQEETWFHPGIRVVVDVILDDDRIDAQTFLSLLDELGWQGYGAGASRGAGRFEVVGAAPRAWRAATGGEVLLTLGHCTPLGVTPTQRLNSFYRAVVHHGRHGALGSGPGHDTRVVKAPILLALPGAVLAPPAGYALPFYGRGLGGDGSLSLVAPLTVHQGYAPVLPVTMNRYVHDDADGGSA